MCEAILLESVKPKYKRKYDCPYCDYRSDREELVHHLEDDHLDVIPKGFTPARVIFNVVNKKEFGTCIVCTGESAWNESAWRYDRICSDKCRSIYKKDMIDKRMMNKYNKTTLLNDPDHQIKMLANRKISGTYRFKDGTKKTFTGSYEKNLFNMMDTILDIPSKDILAPGPVIEYEFEGKTLNWITDLYYIPFNLVFDVKDGGSNKNTHPGMQVNRDKQIAKEEAIRKQGKYNYIRLTDNKFEQLMTIMLDIKSNLTNDITIDKIDPIIHINEAMIGTMSSRDEPYAYLLPYSDNDHSVEGIGFSKDILMKNTFVLDDEHNIVVKDKDFFDSKYFSIIEIPSNKEGYKEILKDAKDKKEILELDYFVEKMLNISHINEATVDNLNVIYKGYDMSSFDILKEIRDIASYKEELLESTLNENSILYECAIYNKDVTKDIDIKLEGYRDLVIRENHEGYFVKNKISGRRSKYYESVDIIPKPILRLLEYQNKSISNSRFKKGILVLHPESNKSIVELDGIVSSSLTNQVYNYVLNNFTSSVFGNVLYIDNRHKKDIAEIVSVYEFKPKHFVTNTNGDYKPKDKLTRVRAEDKYSLTYLMDKLNMDYVLGDVNKINKRIEKAYYKAYNSLIKIVKEDEYKEYGKTKAIRIKDKSAIKTNVEDLYLGINPLLTIASTNLWDLMPNARSEFGNEISNKFYDDLQVIAERITDMIGDINFKVVADGDWDTGGIYIIY